MNGYRVLLFLAFFGVGVALYVAISFGQKLDQELIQIDKLSQQNHKLSQQIASEQAALQQSNDTQTAYLQCLLESQNLGNFPGTCIPPVAIVPKTNAQQGGVSGSINTSQRNSSGSSSNSSPASNAITTVVQTLKNLVKGL